MANENTPNTNSSQFFFTLDRAEWLDKKHTIFGKITGNTIFNALRMGDVDTDGEVCVTLKSETLTFGKALFSSCSELQHAVVVLRRCFIEYGV